MDKNPFLSRKGYSFKGSFGEIAHFLNFWILQWLTIRLCYEERTVITSATIYEVSMHANGSCGVGFNKVKEEIHRRYGIMFGAVPLTGYYGRWRYIFGRPLYICGSYGKR